MDGCGKLPPVSGVNSWVSFFVMIPNGGGICTLVTTEMGREKSIDEGCVEHDYWSFSTIF